MYKLSPLDLRNSLTDAEFKIHCYKLSIHSLNDLLDDFEKYGMYEDCSVMFQILNEKINAIVTRID
jgi:Zn-dependent M32 family carboxypeptidase